MKYLGVIPARAGSKRLPGKNSKMFCGHPLISYTINAAKQSELLTDWTVSTESREIESLALSYGSPTQTRPDYLADDSTTTGEVLAHVLQERFDDGQHFDAVVCLHPTSPLRDHHCIDYAIKAYERGQNPYLASVTHTPLKKHDNHIDIFGEWVDPFYVMNGAIYIIDSCTLLEEKRHTPEKAHDLTTYFMRPYESIDIDTEWDFVMAEAVMRHRDAKRHEG